MQNLTKAEILTRLVVEEHITLEELIILMEDSKSKFIPLPHNFEWDGPNQKYIVTV